MPLPFMSKKKTPEDIAEENETLRLQEENEDLQLSITQKQVLRRKLEESGLTVKNDFGGSLKRAWTWLNRTKKDTG